MGKLTLPKSGNGVGILIGTGWGEIPGKEWKGWRENLGIPRNPG